MMKQSTVFDSSAALRLGQLLRLALTSDRDGEVLGAVRAINRTLVTVGSDAHALADLTERALTHPPTLAPPPPPPDSALEELRVTLRYRANRLHLLSEKEGLHQHDAAVPEARRRRLFDEPEAGESASRAA